MAHSYVWEYSSIMVTVKKGLLTNDCHGGDHEERVEDHRIEGEPTDIGRLKWQISSICVCLYMLVHNPSTSTSKQTPTTRSTRSVRDLFVGLVCLSARPLIGYPRRPAPCPILAYLHELELECICGSACTYLSPLPSKRGNVALIALLRSGATITGTSGTYTPRCVGMKSSSASALPAYSSVMT